MSAGHKDFSGGRTLSVLDRPGTYSLRARSPDEEVTRDAVLGRLAGETVFHCPGEAGAIREALDRALSADLPGALNPYGDGKTVPRILSVLTSLPEREALMHKRFIDIEVPGG